MTTITAHEFSRNFALEDISIRSGPGNEDGRTVEAYASAFDVPAKINDFDGEYEEVIDRKAFDRAIQMARPSGGREAWRVGVFFNHAMNLHGGPSDAFSVPIGICLDMKADSRGLWTLTRYHRSAEAIIEGIREGSLSAYSFSGSFLRSSPSSPSARSEKFRRGPDGRLRTVRRLESTLREFGPCPFPAYKEAEVVGVRSEQRRKLAAFRAKAIVDGIDLDDYAKQIIDGRGTFAGPRTGHVGFSARTRHLCRELGIDLHGVGTR